MAATETARLAVLIDPDNATASVVKELLEVARLAPRHTHARHRADAVGRTVAPALHEASSPAQSLGVPHCPTESQVERAWLTVRFNFLLGFGSLWHHPRSLGRQAKPWKFTIDTRVEGSTASASSFILWWAEALAADAARPIPQDDGIS